MFASRDRSERSSLGRVEVVGVEREVESGLVPLRIANGTAKGQPCAGSGAARGGEVDAHAVAASVETNGAVDRAQSDAQVLGGHLTVAHRNEAVDRLVSWREGVLEVRREPAGSLL